ncbi:MAG: hypothetical protein RL262_1744 [Bacteroidota bacterium]
MKKNETKIWVYVPANVPLNKLKSHEEKRN